jgi:putative transposase
MGAMSSTRMSSEQSLEIENTRLEKLLANALLENEVTREVLRKKW